MATNLPITGKFRITCIFKKRGNWLAGWHTGIDIVSDDKTIYATCNGTIYKTGKDSSYGNYVVIKSSESNTYHWLCHLSKIICKKGDKVTRTTRIGVMGATGNATGVHVHYEIRKSDNKYANVNNPATYMGIPNKVGTYNSNDYQIKAKVEYYKKCSNDETSIVDALKSINVDSTFDYRKKIAKKNGFINYEGTAKQNELMLDILKAGKLKKV